MTQILPPSEVIYDAALDTEAFEHLPSLLAEMFAARSVTLHWQSIEKQECGEMAHNKYFSDEQLGRLDVDFVGQDLWSNAVKAKDRVNRPWIAGQLVPPEAYENGRLYNDWVRKMGDDSFHALGLAMNGGSLIGELGFHRGRRQRPFDDLDVATLTTLLSPLRRMFDIRARLTGEREHRSDIANLLDRASDAMLILRSDGRPIHFNLAAEAMLTKGDALFLQNGAIQQRDAQGAASFSAVITAAGKGATPKGATIPLRGADGSQYVISVAPVMVGTYRRVILVVTNPRGAATSRTEEAARLFGLSPAETEIASLLALGMSPRAIADRRAVSVLTVRGQTKTIMSKLGVRRQAEIVVAFASIPGIPPAKS